MISNALLNVVKALTDVCNKNNIKIVLTGGIAVSLYARPRATYDVDAIISIKKEEKDKFLKAVYRKGFKYDKTNPIKHIRNLSFLPLLYKETKLYADIFIAEDKFQQNIIKRAKRIRLDNKSVYIISPEDLILLKLLTGRERDTEDVRNIICDNLGKIDFKYIKYWSEQLKVKVFFEDELRSLGIKK